MKPLAIDLCCGKGGWTEGLQSVGYEVVGFDVVNHGYAGSLILQDVRTLDGRQFRGATVIVASPPCQEFSRWDMPWLRAKNPPLPDLSIWQACVQIAEEARVPLVIENVRGAQKFMGRSVLAIGCRHLWGDVPILRPDITTNSKKWTKGRQGGASRIAYRSKVETPIGAWIGRSYAP